MSVSDPISDMLTRMRNAIVARHNEVRMPHSRMREELARVLKTEGYVDDYRVEQDGKFMVVVVQLKYVGTGKQRRSVITGLKRVSKPGRRIYSGYRDIPWVLSGMGISVITTPRGVMTGDQARRQKVGGEVLCYVW